MSKIMLLFCSLAITYGVAAQSIEIERGPSYTRFKPSQPENIKVPRHTGGYVELASGLNRLVDGQWVASDPQILVDGNGLSGSGAPHSLFLAPNINTHGAVEVTDTAGTVIKSHVYGVAFYDPITEETLLIAELQNSFAEIVSPNEVIYRNVSAEISADIRYTYSRTGIEQDFILKVRPTPEEWGFNSETVQLLVLTEIVTKPQLVRNGSVVSTNLSGFFIGLNLLDEDLSLGSMILGKGKAFLTKPNLHGGELPSLKHRGGAAVGKTRLFSDNREFLVETVNYADIEPELEHLPEGIPVAKLRGKQKKLQTLIARTVPYQPGDVKKVMVASKTSSEPGFVIDYALLNSSAADLVLRGDTTYYVSGALILTNLTIEPGTVVKYSTNGSITVRGGVYCPGNDYLPSIFTSKDDDSIGETISGSSGNPVGYYAISALAFDNNISVLRNIRIHNAKVGISYGNGTAATNLLWHSEILECEKAFVVDKSVRLRNVLLFNNRTNFDKTVGSSISVMGEHLTVHNGNVLNNSASISLNLTNSMIVSITTTGIYSGANNVFLTSDSGIFNKVAGGEHYLVDNSPYRDVGTTNIHRVLRDQLAKRTTFAPNTYAFSTVSENLTLSPSIYRDTGLPDLGWHPPAIDFYVRELTMTNGAHLILTNGVAIATAGNFGIKGNGTINSGSSPLNPNIISVSDYVQESRTNNMGGVTPSNHKIILEGDSVELSFTHVSLGSKGSWHVFGPITNGLTVKDSVFIGGSFIVSDDVSSNAQIGNSTFEQSLIYFGGTNLDLGFFNNTLRQSSLSLFTDSGSSGWQISDNLFDRSSFGIYSSPVNASHNGFYSSWSNDSATNNLYLSSLIFENGPFGKYYLPVNHPAVRKGSRNADAAGLYHYTTRFDQMKATNGIVSIGRHYPATGTNDWTVFAWVDDRTPGDATTGSEGGDSWNWTTNPPSISGASNHVSNLSSSTHQHYFHSTVTNRLAVLEGDRLFAYISADPTNPPTEIMLQWNVGDGSIWDHRAFWGGDKITSWGPRTFFGTNILSTNVWTRLEVPAWAVDLENKTVDPNGLAFTLYGGRANWDYAGNIRYQTSYNLFDSDSDGLPDILEDLDGNGNHDAFETDWEMSDTDEDGASDLIETELGRNGNAPAFPDSTNSTALKIFTPLK